MSEHRHQLTECHDCDGNGVNDWDPGWCETCHGRGYIEVCRICGQPMGNARRRWKRKQGNR
jgi:DnaJ-class molecular chaperone